MKPFNLIALSCLLLASKLNAEPASFFASQTKQDEAPAAYALSSQNLHWLELAHQQRDADARKVFEALKQDSPLFKQLKNWSELSFKERMGLLPQVFAIECEAMGITPPTLIINSELYPQRAVNFVFDVRYPGSGLVYLNPDKLKQMELFAPLAFLLHETRHAYQFQLAYRQQGILAQGYQAAFEAQSRLSGASFSDFLTLLNEYEAFQFGNHVLELLTEGEFESPMMGTLASQFGHDHQLKIDLIKLNADGEAGTILEKFNRAVQSQYRLRYPAD